MSGLDVPPIAGVGARKASSGIDWGAHLHPQVLANLVTDHAGEVGAVCIYQGVLRIARDPSLRAFAQRHLAAEQNHLRQIETWLPPDHYSHLLPVWRLAGFLTGALPALLGPKCWQGCNTASFCKCGGSGWLRRDDGRVGETS